MSCCPKTWPGCANRTGSTRRLTRCTGTGRSPRTTRQLTGSRVFDLWSRDCLPGRWSPPRCCPGYHPTSLGCLHRPGVHICTRVCLPTRECLRRQGFLLLRGFLLLLRGFLLLLRGFLPHRASRHFPASCRRHRRSALHTLHGWTGRPSTPGARPGQHQHARPPPHRDRRARHGSRQGSLGNRSSRRPRRGWTDGTHDRRMAHGSHTRPRDPSAVGCAS